MESRAGFTHRRKTATAMARALYGLLAATIVISGLALAEEPSTSRIDAGLQEFLGRFDEARLIPVTERVSLAFGYDAGNIVVIEGDDGVILIDTGWKVELGKKVAAEIALKTDKPIVAIIYSHGHLDHTGGVRAFVPPEREAEIEIYAHENWRRYQVERVSSRLPHIAFRIAAQLGVLLPEESYIGTAIGPMPRDGRTISYIPPTKTVGDYTELEISGVKLELHYMPSELDDELVVWLPEEKIIYAADVVGGVSPFGATPRFEQGRSVDGLIDGIERMMEFPAEYLLKGHGGIYSGHDEILEILQATRDANQYLRDQTIRQLANNITREQAAANVKLPDHLANHPELQERYHRVSWVVKGLYTKLGGGWYGGDPLEMVRHTPAEEAARLVALVGGPQAVLGRADNALHSGDPVWAAQLSGYVIANVGSEAPDLRLAREIRARAFRLLASQTPSANEYSYLLTDALELEGSLVLSDVIPKIVQGLVTPDMYRLVPTADLLRDMGPRLDAERSLNTVMTLGLSFTDRNEERGLIVRRGVIQYLPERPEKADLRAELTRRVLDEIMAGRGTWDDMLASGRVKVSGSAADFKKFMAYFDF